MPPPSRAASPWKQANATRLPYVAAEKVYIRGDLDGAKTSFTRYLQQFPQGAFALNAHYYLGLIAYNRKDFATARQHLDKVIEYPNNEYSEEAIIMGGRNRLQ